MTHTKPSYTKEEFVWESGLDPLALRMYEKCGFVSKIMTKDRERPDLCYSAHDLALVLQMSTILKTAILSNIKKRRINLRTAFRKARALM
ncbi:MAG: hypothetical protein ACLP5H_33825 [Desulfomonilaceae bacterium]